MTLLSGSSTGALVEGREGSRVYGSRVWIIYIRIDGRIYREMNSAIALLEQLDLITPYDPGWGEGDMS